MANSDDFGYPGRVLRLRQRIVGGRDKITERTWQTVDATGGAELIRADSTAREAIDG